MVLDGMIIGAYDLMSRLSCVNEIIRCFLDLVNLYERIEIEYFFEFWVFKLCCFLNYKTF
jgi:hypothetical protein